MANNLFGWYTARGRGLVGINIVGQLLLVDDVDTV